MKSEKLQTRLDYIFPRLLIFTIVLYLYKRAFWPLTFPYLLVQALVLLIFLIRKKWEINIYDFIKTFKYPIILSAIIFITALVNNDFLNKTLLKDIVLMTIMFSFYFFLFWTTKSLKARIPVRYTLDLIIYTTLFVSIINLVYNLSWIHIPSELSIKLNISDGNTIADDYNFFCLLIILGFVALNKYNSFFPKNKYNFILLSTFNIIYIINIVFSTSRRGIIVFIIVLIYLFITGISEMRKNQGYKKIIIKSIMVMSIIAGLFFTGLYIVKNVPSHKISMIVLRYSNFLGKNNYEELNKKLWEPSNNLPKEIDSTSMIKVLEIKPETWKRFSSNIKTYKIKDGTKKQLGIKIRNNEIQNAKIYSKSSGKIYFATHTYKITFKFKTLSVNTVDAIRAGWWTDDGNMGNQITIAHNSIDSIGYGWYSYNGMYTFMDNHISIAPLIMFLAPECEFEISDFIITDLDFNKELYRQKYTSKDSYEILRWVNIINPQIDNGTNLLMNGDFKYGFKFWGYSADSLKISIESEDSLTYARIRRGDGNGGYYSLFYSGRRIVFTQNNQYELSFKLKPIFPGFVPFNVGFWINEGDGYKNNLKLEIDTLSKGWLNVETNFAFKNTLGDLVFPINSQIDNSEFLITDIKLRNITQLQNLSTNFSNSDTLAVQDVLFLGRNSRLIYASEIWGEKYTLLNKLFGKGFIYYEWFGEKFWKDPSRGDYPHNPIVSIILYSGIVGVIIYLWILFKTFSIYYKHKEKFSVLLVCFVITLFFAFFSGSTPFDPPIMGFFMLLPYYFDFLIKNDSIIATSSI